MPLPSVKKGSSAGRVRMAFTHPQTTLVNYYVGGAGVGAVSTSNRRALRSRASWRPTQDGKGSTRCGGFCQPNRLANNVEFVRQGGRGAVNDKPEVVTKDDDITKNVPFQASMTESGLPSSTIIWDDICGDATLALAGGWQEWWNDETKQDCYKFLLDAAEKSDNVGTQCWVYSLVEGSEPKYSTWTPMWNYC
jgi:hypothetical protein